jgi:methyl-accepting chemotaxis protein
MSTNMSNVAQGIQEVNQSSSVSGEISRDIAGVSVSMNEMSTSSGQVNLSAQELSKLSETLKQRIGKSV